MWGLSALLPFLVEMSDLLSLSKRLPLLLASSFTLHPYHICYSVPSNTVNLLEQRLSSHRPHDTNTVGSLSTAGKQAFFFFSCFFFFFFKQANQTANSRA